MYPPLVVPLSTTTYQVVLPANEGRVEQLYTNVQATGLALPFPSQPLQGFSGIRSLGDGRFLVLTDNGFGSKANSSDVILMFNIIKPDWDSGHVAIEETDSTIGPKPQGALPNYE